MIDFLIRITVSSVVLTLSLSTTTLADQGKDWRKNTSLEEKVSRIINTLPSTANIIVKQTPV